MKSDSLTNYQIKNPIGRGAGSFVCKITNRLTKNEFAAKIISKTSTNPQKLQNEVRIHTSLDHNNIVQLHEHFEDTDNYYLIMELCDQELYHLIKQCKMTESEIRHYGKHLALALQYLHYQNIIHRDIKLSNLLIKDKTLKVADFGLAVKLTDDQEERSTLCGTPNYISPEILNQQPYGKKVDLWSMGCCLYAMLMGKGPFEEQSTALCDVLRKVKSGSFVLPEQISPAFKDLLINLINLDAEQRYSIQQIIDHSFFKDKILELPYKSRNQSSSNIKQLLDVTPLVKQQHRQTCSMIGLEKQQVLTQFLQKQQAIGGKKLLFGMTTIGKESQSKTIDMENLPKFNLPQDKENIKPHINLNKTSQIEIKQQSQKSLFNQSPIKTKDLKQCKLQIKTGTLQIYQDGKFEMEILNKNLKFIIENNGMSITVIKEGGKGRVYALQDLPTKLQKFYIYSKQVCNAIRERSSNKNRIYTQNEHGTFEIKSNKQYEADILQSKIKVKLKLIQKLQIIHQLNSDVFKLISNKGSKNIQLSEFQQKQWKMDPNEVYSVKLALKYLDQLKQ